LPAFRHNRSTDQTGFRSRALTLQGATSDTRFYPFLLENCTMGNRIMDSVASVSRHIEKRIGDGLTTAERVDALKPELGFGVEEYCRFQELKTLAVANGFLSSDEGMTVYALLGDTDSLSVAQLVVLNGLLAQLLNHRTTGYYPSVYTAPVFD
jgi:hypothetical protein